MSPLYDGSAQVSVAAQKRSTGRRQLTVYEICKRNNAARLTNSGTFDDLNTSSYAKNIRK
jgi:hypothetical protein